MIDATVLLVACPLYALVGVLVVRALDMAIDGRHDDTSATATGLWPFTLVCGLLVLGVRFGPRVARRLGGAVTRVTETARLRRENALLRARLEAVEHTRGLPPNRETS